MADANLIMLGRLLDRKTRSNRNLLHFIERNLILPSVVKGGLLTKL